LGKQQQGLGNTNKESDQSHQRLEKQSALEKGIASINLYLQPLQRKPSSFSIQVDGQHPLKVLFVLKNV
jgi:hypothetical protein